MQPVSDDLHAGVVEVFTVDLICWVYHVGLCCCEIYCMENCQLNILDQFHDTLLFAPSNHVTVAVRVVAGNPSVLPALSYLVYLKI
jgi:hypothetical protein